MRKRIQMAQQQGCHGVDPDNVDGYTQSDLGFHLTYDNQIDYNRFLARGKCIYLMYHKYLNKVFLPYESSLLF